MFSKARFFAGVLKNTVEPSPERRGFQRKRFVPNPLLGPSETRSGSSDCSTVGVCVGSKLGEGENWVESAVPGAVETYGSRQGSANGSSGLKPVSGVGGGASGPGPGCPGDGRSIGIVAVSSTLETTEGAEKPESGSSQSPHP